MDHVWQAFLGLSQPALPRGFCTAHFSHEELQELVDAFSGGNTLSDPTSIGTIAEEFYCFEGYQEFIESPAVKAMIRDGLGHFLNVIWDMISKKKAVIERELNQ